MSKGDRSEGLGPRDEDVCLSTESVDRELVERIGGLNLSKAACLEGLSLLYKDVEVLLANDAPKEELNCYLEKISVSFGYFQTVHLDYCQGLESKPELLTEALHSYNEQLRKKLDMVSRLNNTLRREAEREMLNVKPEDSVSRAGSQRSSRSSLSSVPSSASSSEIRRVRAKQAVARLKMKQLKQRQELLKQEEEMKMNREMLEIRNEIEQADLEAQIIEDDDCVDACDVRPPAGELDPNSKESVQRDIKGPFGTSNLVVRPTKSTENNMETHSSINLGKTEEQIPAIGPIPLPDTSVNESSPRLKVNNDQNDLQQLAMTIRQGFVLPKPDLPKYDGNPLNYWGFIRSFENTIERNTFNENEKRMYLLQYCTGEANKVIRSCAMMDPSEGYKAARKLLKERFGHPYKIAMSCIRSVINGGQIKASDSAGLLAFADQLMECETTLEAIGYLDEVNSSDNLKRVVERLPYHLKAKWLGRAQDLLEAGKRPRLNHISEFVMARAKSVNNPIFAGILNDESKQPRDPIRQRRPTGVNFGIEGGIHQNQHFQAEEDATDKHEKCPLCYDNHRLENCDQFKRGSHEENMRTVRSLMLCDNCFVIGHLAKGCMKRSACEISGCNRRHKTILHPPKKDRKQEASDTSQGGNSGQRNGNCSSTNKGGSVCLRIVPVKVKNKIDGTVIETYAFLDSGSDVTLCDEQLVQELGLQGTERSFSLTTQEKRNSLRKGLEVDLVVEALDGSESLNLQNVWTVKQLNVSPNSIATPNDIRMWPHLEGVYLPSIEKDVRILIGSNVPEAFWVLEERRGEKGEPYAIRSPLGWSVLGPVQAVGIGRDKFQVNFIRDSSGAGYENDVLLNKQVKKFWETDFGDSISDPKSGMSVEDKRALRMMEDSVELFEGHYRLGLPWRHQPPRLQNNRKMAQRRLDCLRRKFQKDPELFERYKASINEYIEKGYAKRISENNEGHECKNTTFYLPHHAVCNPNKPGKIRVVFDCAAQFNGTSLNDELLPGPDQTNNLVGVLTRFREHPVALVADVEGMFHQVRVSPDDHDALRFLWWPNDDLSREPVDYCMQVHLFGSTSSPSCASFCLRKTADDHEDKFDEAVTHTVKRNFYVDDCLKSLVNVEAAKAMATDLCDLLAKGGFRLTKWLSNKKDVIQSIPGSERATSVVDLELDDELPIERPLGAQWHVEQDVFSFKIAPKENPITRRGLLSTTSSVYDPLGMVAPAILPAKKIMQELCRKNVGWDDKIGALEEEQWTKWLTDLPALSGIHVNRCMKPEGFGEIKTVQLHHFSDASQAAYGAVSYVRFVNEENMVHCAFLLGKSRLAPIKPMTVPRLELSAAVMAVQMDQFLRRELDLTIDESVFWTDSTSVLRYIENESSRFHTFVANRVALIHDGSLPSQWRYVNT